MVKKTKVLDVMTIHPISLKTRNFNLMVALEDQVKGSLKSLGFILWVT